MCAQHCKAAWIVVCSTVWFVAEPPSDVQAIEPTHLRCEYRQDPLGIDQGSPRLSWKVQSHERNQSQSAYRILVASTKQNLVNDNGDLWDSGKVDSNQTLFVTYQGVPLESRQQCYWKVCVWDGDGHSQSWSRTARWSMGLLKESDWTANYISVRDASPVYKDTDRLHLPPAQQYRKEFRAEKRVVRATVYATALGIYELHFNGQPVSDAFFAPGWTDYRQRAYYNTYDVTDMLHAGDNAIGAWLADGWYSGYVGFGLLTGMGTEKTGRATYGKTPSLMAQLEIEYADGSRQVIATDPTWKVTQEGPIREADLLMGEYYDARFETPNWSSPGFDDGSWQPAVLAEDNGHPIATFYQRRNPTRPGQGVQNLGQDRDLGFQRPKLEAFPGVPVRITEQVRSQAIVDRGSGTFIIDLGQNFAGTIRLAVQGPSGQKIRIRYGEMLHPDGRLMTENLRKARATDFYVCRGNPNGETYQPRFTFHGFRYVELSDFPGTPDQDTVTGLVMHSDTPMVSSFECSDPMVNQLFSNVLWTQRSNFLDLPTDCPQRDERMGWTGDAQAYVATAAYNADIGAFYTKWLRELMESQRPSGVFPGYAPFPFQHGWDFGTAWADAGVICPWTIWQFYGDTRIIHECWDPMTKFMQWRMNTCVDDLGITHGNAWGDWLTQGGTTPLDYIDTIYLAISSKMMAEMATAIGRDAQHDRYKKQYLATKAAFQAKYLNDDGSVNVNTQTAQALALYADLIPENLREKTGQHLAKMLADNGNRMSTGFLGTRPLLPVLSASGQHDLATFLLQSRDFPSWGYEIVNGATTIWERWDSYTKEDAFGRHNAAMNSFSHYAFGAVCEWMFASLAGIQSDGPGFKHIIIRPGPPSRGSNAMREPIHWVKASYDSIRGPISSEWALTDNEFHLKVRIPANTTATVYLPTSDSDSITESGKPLDDRSDVSLIDKNSDVAVLSVPSGTYEFAAIPSVSSAATALATSEPKDFSVNPDNIKIAGARKIASWDFTNAQSTAQWTERSNLKLHQRDGKTIVAATGNDSQMAVRLAKPAEGKLVIQLRAMPDNGATSQFFWARPGQGFRGDLSSKRKLSKTDRVQDYIFAIPGDGPVSMIRFDPFANFDPYADVAEMTVESITLFQLPD